MIHFTPKPEDRWILEINIDPANPSSFPMRDYIWSKRKDDWQVKYSKTTVSNEDWIRCDGMNAGRPGSFYDEAKFVSLSEEEALLLCL